MDRVKRDREPMRTPLMLDGGLVVLDASWGEIKPMVLAEGVRTVGELEVIEHRKRGLDLIDSRSADSYAEGTIPGARNVPHGDAAESIAELDPDRPTLFFCNGPQCGASPDAISDLLEAGHPPSAILYYRGGLHDWLSLGLPIAKPDPG
jgi:rhodanese-related sulfurtransferase